MLLKFESVSGCQSEWWTRCMLGETMTFFFQAEDGIRGHCVTGVQTCALPISLPLYFPPQTIDGRRLGEGGLRAVLGLDAARRVPADLVRSEERRVGKECKIGSAAKDPTKSIPPRDDAAEVRVGLRLPIRMVDPVHVGRDDDFFFSSRRRHTRSLCDWSSDVCSSDLAAALLSAADDRRAAIGRRRVAGGAGARCRAARAGRSREIGRASCRERV